MSRVLASLLERPVLNQTGITGEYDIFLEWPPKQEDAGAALLGPAPEQPDRKLGSIFTEIRKYQGPRYIVRVGQRPREREERPGPPPPNHANQAKDENANVRRIYFVRVREAGNEIDCGTIVSGPVPESASPRRPV